jgi:hypothetical protein
MPKTRQEKDADFKLLLAIAVATTALSLVLFLLRSSLAFAVFLLAVYSWPPAVHRLITRKRKLVEIMEELVSKSKVLEDPWDWAEQAVKYYMLGLPASLVLGLVLYVSVSPEYVPLGGTVVGITYFYPYVRSADMRSELKRRVEMELPIASMMMWGLSEIGYDVMRIVDIMKQETEEMKAIPRELSVIHRNYVVFNMRPDDAVYEETRDHPSKLFEKLLGGAVAISSIGGELSVHFSRMTTEVLQWLKNSWETFGKAVSNLGELSLLFLLMVPMVALWFGLVEGNPLNGVSMVDYLILPLVGIGLYFYLSTTAPLEYLKVDGDLKWGALGLAVGAVADVVLALLFKYDQAWLLVALLVMGFSLGYGYKVDQTIRRKNDIESHIAVFVRAMAEHVRTTGDNLYTAVSKLVGSRSFGKELNKFLRRYLLLSSAYSDAVPEADSWIGRSILEIMMRADKEGVLRYEILRKLAEFADNYYDAIQAKKRGLAMFLGSAIASPAVLVGMVGLTYVILTSIAGLTSISSLQQASTLGVNLSPQVDTFVQFFQVFQNVGQIMQQIVPGLEIGIVETGIIYGVLLAKGYDGTVKNTMRVFEITLVSVVSIIVLNLVLLKFV